MNKKMIWVSTLTATTIVLILLPVSWGTNNVSSNSSLLDKIKGKILLQVEKKGQAWYVNPSDEKRYYLGKPKDAFQIMRRLGIGISDEDLAKIPIGVLNNSPTQDSDQDGLRNELEKAIGSDPEAPDSDGDGYKDKTELLNNYNPASPDQDKKNIDLQWSRQQAGKIFLQTQNHGEAWYINPKDNKRYFLGKPGDAWQVMRELGLGISDQDLQSLPQGDIGLPTSHQTRSTTTSSSSKNNDQNDNSTCSECFSAATTKEKAATAIKNGYIDQAVKYFTSSNKKTVSYTVKTLNDKQRSLLASIINRSQLKTNFGGKKTYKKKVSIPLAGEGKEVKFTIEKQDNGKWLLTNLGE